MNLKSFLFLILTFLVYLHVVAQVNVDSLKKEYLSPETRLTNKVLLSAEIAGAYLSSQPDSAAFYAREGIESAKEINNYSGLFQNYCVLGRLDLMQHNIEAATLNYEEALDVISHLENKSEALQPILTLGYLYDMQNKYVDAYKVYTEGIMLAEANHDSVWLYSFYNNFGSHLQQLGDFTQSKLMFLKTLEVAATLSPEQLRFSPASAYSNLALIYMDKQDLDSALYFLNQAWDYPGSREDAYGEQIMAINYTDIYLDINKPDSVDKYLAIQKSDLEKMEGSFPGSLDFQYAKYYSQLGESQFNNGELQQAEFSLLKAFQNCEQLDEYEVKTEVLKLLTSINEGLGNTKAALKYSKDYVQSLDTLHKRSSGEEMLSLKAKHELDTELLQTRNELELVQLEKERRELIITVIVVVALAIILGMFLSYLLQRNRHERLKSEQELHRVEKEKVAEELEFRKREMTANGMYLAQKNNLILLVNQKLKELLPALEEKNAREIKKIISELETKAHDNSWEEFEKRFTEVHTDFYKRLSKAYPKLTAGDLRLSAFLRLNMSNKEIAAITYQNVESLKTARYRLRKKLGLEREVNLVHFLTRF